MKFILFFSLIFILIANHGSAYESKLSKTSNVLNQGSSKQNQRSVLTISDPMKIEYEYYKIVKLEDGSTVNSFIERGKKDYKDGDYVWSKMIPIYASSEIKYSFEYQMDFTIANLEALGKWLQTHIGENVSVTSIDNPAWYKDDMTLGNIFNYCKTNNSNITMAYANKSLKRMAIVTFDSGSNRTKTSSEIGLVFIIFNSIPSK